LLRSLASTSLPYNAADWYWIPSRAIASMGDVEPITEFPYFTVLYADLHAHLFSLPITLLALAWAISVVKSRAWKIFPQESQILGYLKIIIGLLFGGIVIGALRPTNTWDFPTYLILGVIAIGFGLWKYHSEKEVSTISDSWIRYTYPVLFVSLAFLLYEPFSQWYAQAYSSVDFWNGPRTSFSDYLTHWGLFLFLIVTWMLHETIDWMAVTPLSHLRKLLPFKTILWIVGCSSIFLMVILGLKLPSSETITNLPFGLGSLLFSGVQIVWFVLPMGIWTIILLLRPGQQDEKRIILFMVGTALALTLFVEIVVLRGDIGRMNTVFKFYLQAWILFGISAAMSFGWMFDYIRSLKYNLIKAIPSWVLLWEISVTLLVIAAALYPIMATPGKFTDRMVQDAPHTLDGMAYMQYASYNDQNMEMDLSQDYAAICWMQKNIIGSPVIVEGNVPEYRWGTRYTIYTGLPGVVGWNWHQRQQRGVASNEWVTDRVAEINMFYQSQDLDQSVKFLKKYQVSYIVVGQLERAYYPGIGLDKFAANQGKLWEEVYHNEKTTIYKVLDR
jgi:YYY domain-containing protein